MYSHYEFKKYLHFFYLEIEHLVYRKFCFSDDFKFYNTSIKKQKLV